MALNSLPPGHILCPTLAYEPQLDLTLLNSPIEVDDTYPVVLIPSESFIFCHYELGNLGPIPRYNNYNYSTQYNFRTYDMWAQHSLTFLEYYSAQSDTSQTMPMPAAVISVPIQELELEMGNLQIRESTFEQVREIESVGQQCKSYADVCKNGVPSTQSIERTFESMSQAQFHNSNRGSDTINGGIRRNPQRNSRKTLDEEERAGWVRYYPDFVKPKVS